MEETNWKVGDEVVISSTSYTHEEAEQRVIAAISADGKTITFEEPLEFKHHAGKDIYGDVEFEMRASVAVLTRNIVIQGDETSEKSQYGAHIMMTGDAEDGTEARIQNIELRQCG